MAEDVTIKTDKKRRKEFRSNHRLLSKHFLLYYKDHQRTPSYDELAKLTGLHPRTVFIHMQKDDIMYKEIFDSERAKLSFMSEEIMMAIANSAIKGSSKSQELALQIMYNWAKPEKIEFEDVTKREYSPDDKKEITEGLAELVKELGYVKPDDKKKTTKQPAVRKSGKTVKRSSKK